MGKLTKTFIFIQILGLIFFGLSIQKTIACDICGNTGSSSFTGLLPQVLNNQISLSYQNSLFKHPNTYLNYYNGSRVLKDRFQRYNIGFQYRLNNKLLLKSNVPYNVNKRTEADRITKISALGDISLGLTGILLNKNDSNRTKIKNLILLGGNITLPNGKYQQRDDNKSMLPLQFQSGRGAYSVSAELNHVVQKNQFGIINNIALQLNGENELGQKAGNIIQMETRPFYWVERKKWAAMLFTGFHFQKISNDENFGEVELQTTSERYLTNLGCNLFIKTWILSAYYSKIILDKQEAHRPNLENSFGFSISRIIK